MISTFLRHTLPVLGTLAINATLSSDVSAQQGLTTWRANWGLALSQHFRVCINASTPAASSGAPTELVTVHLTSVSGLMVQVPELTVPNAGFQCLDITYAALIEAGFQPDLQTGALTFLVEVRSRSSTEGTDPRVTTGAIENIFNDSGRIDLYQRFELGK
jgi:hypothetical protein